MSKKTEQLTTPSVFASERKLDPSDGIMRSGLWNNDIQTYENLTLREKSVRGTISNRLKKGAPDPAKFDAAIENANIQTVDIATLPMEHDTLCVQYTLRILGNVGAPNVCNRSDYRLKLDEKVNAYKDEHAFRVISERYAYNLASARFLWRNRSSAENIKVQIEYIVQGNASHTWHFDDALAFSLRNFDVPHDAQKNLESLAQAIQSVLTGNGYGLFKVTAYARMGAGQEVFPSQEFIPGAEKTKKKGEKSKKLYAVNGIAALHSQKIGNAIRTIDTWYPEFSDDKEGVGPIAIEPYGSVTSLGKAFRQPKAKVDFYNLLDRWMLDDDDMQEHELHYLMAILIRGGVFGEAEKKEKES